MLLRVSHVRPWLAILPILAAANDSEPTALAGPPAVEETSPSGQVAAISAIRRGTARHVVVRREGSSADLQAAITAAGGTVARAHRGIGVHDVTNLSAQGLASLRANRAGPTPWLARTADGSSRRLS
jgi:hypothetical protein